jgi:ABC-type multidrug transport system ATPase subunit
MIILWASTNSMKRFLGKRNHTFWRSKTTRFYCKSHHQNPPFYSFDDCLSAVDTETEETILNNLFEICKDKTTIIVSHRVSSAKNADRIIIIENGQIIQQGSHNQLINEEGYYAALYLKQLSEKKCFKCWKNRYFL